MKPLLRVYSLVLLAAGLALSGCYEGMGGSGGNKGGGQGKPGGGPVSKPFGLVIIDTFSPNTDALGDATCGGVQLSMIPVRQLEINARVQGLTDYMSSQADVIRVVPNAIDLTNCQTNQFSEIETRAIQALPPPQVDDSVKAKLALHIRLVMWYGSGGGAGNAVPPNFKIAKPKTPVNPGGFGGPSQNVLSDDWADVAQLRQLGFNRTLSVNEFAATGPQNGYMWTWENNSDPNNTFNADVVVDPPITDDGTNQVLTAAKNSSVKFAEWLTQRTQGL